MNNRKKRCLTDFSGWTGETSINQLTSLVEIVESVNFIAIELRLAGLVTIIFKFGESH
jgi:hypothetical protein